MASASTASASAAAPPGGPSAPSDGSVRVLVRVDHPTKDSLVTLDAKASLGDLRSAIAKIDGVDAKAVPRYTLIAVSFRGAVIELSAEKNKDSASLAELGLRDSATVVARAPPDIAPRKKRVSKAKKDDGDDKKTEAKAASADRYKGFTAANIWKKLEAADLKDPKAATTGKAKLAFEYFDIYAGKLLKKPAFAALPKPVVIAIAKSDTLNCKEIDLFDAVVGWGKEQLKRDKVNDEKGTELKRVLEDVMVHVRFGAMSTQDVALKISSSGFLDGDQILELFTYLGMKSGNKNAVPGKSLSKFVSRERKGRRPPSWFKWDQNKRHNNLVLSNEQLTVTSNNTGYYQPVFGDAELKEGVWEWEIVLTQYTAQGHACNIGVVPTTFTNYTVGHMIGYSGHVPGWAFAVGNAQKQNNTDMQAYGRTCSQGEVIGVRLDLDKRTIEFYINGQSQGIAFRNVNGPVRPALSLYGNQSVTIRFPSTEFKAAEK